tara:strand:+ start:9528 stop:10130 length:603 start_codon:yes stop_codon:yes gene_type:complete
MTTRVNIPTPSLTEFTNIRYIGEIGSGELVLDNPERRNDKQAGTCIPETAYRLLKFIRKGWIDNFSIIVEATNKRDIYKYIDDKEKLKRVKKQMKNANKFSRDRGSEEDSYMTDKYSRHCYLFNKKTNQYIDTSNGRCMIMNKDNFIKAREGLNVERHRLVFELKTGLQEEDDNVIIAIIINEINKKFKKILEDIADLLY